MYFGVKLIMGYLLCIGACASCRKMFEFHPNKVPSVMVNGTRVPVCKPCVLAANPRRITLGLPEITIRPGAYEAADEEEIVFV